jgi:DSF synthase
MLNKTTATGIQIQSTMAGDVDYDARSAWFAPISALPEVEVHYDAEDKTLWQLMKPAGRPSFTLGLIRDLTKVLDAVEQAHRAMPESPVDFMVLGSNMPGVFNLGGDLTLFQQMILAGDRDGLKHYAHACVHGQYRRAVRMNLPICTIALVQGDALGGGFEAALSHDVVIAERSAKFGLPEILFNLFPGMGAFSFLSRRLGTAKAQRLLTSGQIYSAEEMFELGVVDVIAEDGFGGDAVDRYIDQHGRSAKSRLAIAKLRDMVAPLSLQEMLDITDLWVETALTLDARDLRKMRHLVAAQERRLPEMLEEEAPAHRVTA